MAAAKLTDRQRAEVVVRFAQWWSSAQIRQWLKEEHWVEVEPSALTRYNLDNPLSREQAAQKWVELFDRERARVVEDLSTVATAHKAVRMRMLDRQIRKLVDGDRVNLPLLRELLEHQAREEGGTFTNVRLLQHNVRGNLAALLGCDPSELPDSDAADAQP